MLINRPWCCPDHHCTPLTQIANFQDLAKFRAGESFSCWGKMAEAIEVSYAGVPHVNDLCSCHFTPLKGLIRGHENKDDWLLLKLQYEKALAMLEGADKK